MHSRLVNQQDKIHELKEKYSALQTEKNEFLEYTQAMSGTLTRTYQTLLEKKVLQV